LAGEKEERFWREAHSTMLWREVWWRRS
jgi:hypothetical protein